MSTKQQERRLTTVPITEVKVQNRHRADHGDLSKLIDSMRELGQLQPIVLTPDMRLIAGERRLTAASSLGWSTIHASIADSIVDASSLLQAERDENTCRKSFTATEEHSLYQALLDLEASSRPENQTSSRAKKSVAEIVTGNSGRFKTLEKVGEVKQVQCDAAMSERVRTTATEALVEMDRTGNISGPYRRVQLAVKAFTSKHAMDSINWSAEEQQLLAQLKDKRTVVLSYREHHANVVRWATSEGLLIGVDRRTEWGNPFEIPDDGDRDTVIRNYRDHYLPYKPSLLARLRELRGKALVCWCAPEPCHGDVLKEAAKESGW